MLKRCPNDNHGRMVVTVRFCPSCGDVVNRNIVVKECLDGKHAGLRRSRHAYCMDCGTGILAAAGAGRGR